MAPYQTILKRLSIRKMNQAMGDPSMFTVKRRPKAFLLLNKPRGQFQDIAHRNRYWKNNLRKSCA
jgi:hypothetical protein